MHLRMTAMVSSCSLVFVLLDSVVWSDEVVLVDLSDCFFLLTKVARLLVEKDEKVLDRRPAATSWGVSTALSGGKETAGARTDFGEVAMFREPFSSAFGSCFRLWWSCELL